MTTYDNLHEVVMLFSGLLINVLRVLQCHFMTTSNLFAKFILFFFRKTGYFSCNNGIFCPFL